MIQTLCLIAMEKPCSKLAEDLRNEKVMVNNSGVEVAALNSGVFVKTGLHYKISVITVGKLQR